MLPGDHIYNKSIKTLTYPNKSVVNFIAIDRPDDVKKIKNDVFGWVWLAIIILSPSLLALLSRPPERQQAA